EQQEEYLSETDSQLYNQLNDFYSDLIKDMQDHPNRAYLRVGAGKSYYYNSIGMALLKASPATFKRMMSLFSLGKVGQKIFPITRTITTTTKAPLGWIYLTDPSSNPDQKEAGKQAAETALAKGAPPQVGDQVEAIIQDKNLGTVIYWDGQAVKKKMLEGINLTSGDARFKNGAKIRVNYSLSKKKKPKLTFVSFVEEK
ncbi:MAG: hypothetical protein AAFU64_16845, partial [Bacteroidota bacterium]